MYVMSMLNICMVGAVWHSHCHLWHIQKDNVSNTHLSDCAAVNVEEVHGRDGQRVIVCVQSE
jgi:hypothetical protein